MHRIAAAACTLLACLSAVPAFAQDAPRRKSGLWEVSMSMPNMGAPMVMRQCIDQATDDMSKSASRDPSAKCSKQSVRREGGNVVVESVCQVEGSTATSRGVFSGDFNAAYKGEMVTKFSPPMHGTAETKMNFQARHVGPCAPGQKPGDVAMQGMPGGGRAAGKMSPDDARRMAEEMRKQYGK
jgi:hypothetical protein